MLDCEALTDDVELLLVHRPLLLTTGLVYLNGSVADLAVHAQADELRVRLDVDCLGNRVQLAADTGPISRLHDYLGGVREYGNAVLLFVKTYRVQLELCHAVLSAALKYDL